VLHSILLVFQILIALALIATILLQSSRSAGVSGVIAGGAESLFSKKKGLDEFFMKISAWLGALFFLLTLLLSLV